MLSDIYKVFRDKDRRKIYWYRRDRFNIHGAHNPHWEYNHPEFIKAALENPLEIRQDIGKKRRKCFYGEFTQPKLKVTKLMKVIVDYVGFSPVKFGILITAFAVVSPQPSEKIIWKRN
jgi:hypothetical protein